MRFRRDAQVSLHRAVGLKSRIQGLSSLPQIKVEILNPEPWDPCKTAIVCVRHLVGQRLVDSKKDWRMLLSPFNTKSLKSCKSELIKRLKPYTPQTLRFLRQSPPLHKPPHPCLVMKPTNESGTAFAKRSPAALGLQCGGSCPR